MPYDDKGRWFDGPAQGAVPPTVPEGHGQAPPTRYEDGGAAGGLPPVQPFPGMQAFSGGGGGGGMGAPQAAGAATVFDDDTEANERLMGFLVILDTKQDDEWRYFRLKKGVNKVGRFGSRAHVELRDGQSSEEHALVICTNNAARVIDLDSSNGTKVNRNKVEIALLKEGDRMRIGRTELMYVPFPYVAED